MYLTTIVPQLLTDGYLFFNFLDVIKEGDGDRVIRQYKYLMFYCKADGTHSTKYALECLYQLFLVYALLTPRDSERFVWNRLINNHGKKGCNIPLDESTEHSNNFVKQCIRKLGPNISETAVSGLCKAESSITQTGTCANTCTHGSPITAIYMGPFMLKNRQNFNVQCGICVHVYMADQPKLILV